MKAPRKSELLRLQALYKTDARIAEVLSVEEYLVAYWRRKKHIPRHSAPKFSRDQVAELWARYGDDFRCGRELNISKAAYYSWRRKYGILDRPAELKLEQLELRLASEPPLPDLPKVSVARTGTRKILERCRSDWPESDIPADWRITGTGDGDGSVFIISPGPEPRQPLAGSGADVLPVGDMDEPTRVTTAYGLIEWQLVEARVVPPGQLVVTSGQLVAGLGGVGSLVLAEETAETPHRILRVELTRKLSARVDVEDVVLALLARSVDEDWRGAIVEFLGGPVERLSLDRKVKLCSLVAHYGAKAAICSFDDIIRRHYGRLLRGRFPQSHPDRTATYDREHFLEGSGVQPQIAVSEGDGSLQVRAPDGSRTGGVVIGPDALPYEIEEIAAAVRGRRISPDTSLMVVPATPSIYRLAQRRGWAEAIIAAGGSVLDVALARRMGTACIMDVAAGRTGEIACTRPSDGLPSSLRVNLTSARTAAGMLNFL